jgi:phosphoglycolate phosphatase
VAVSVIPVRAKREPGMTTRMPYSLVIFDLDGTLVDSFPWFLRNINDTADKFGFRRVPEDEIASLRRTGLREIFERLEVPPRKLPAIVRHMRRLKNEQAASIALFPGVAAMLHALIDGGPRLAVVSSDREANARRQLGAGIATLFSSFDCGASLFGKAAKFRRAVRRAGVHAKDAIAIGDEIRDIEAARAAGIACAAVTWGYSAPDALLAYEPDVVFERIGDIARVLLAEQ